MVRWIVDQLTIAAALAAAVIAADAVAGLVWAIFAES